MGRGGVGEGWRREVKDVGRSVESDVDCVSMLCIADTDRWNRSIMWVLATDKPRY